MKKTLITIMCILVLFCSFTARANEPPHDIGWNIANGTLTITGQGAMADYANPEDAPWHNQRSEITKIVIEDGITHIGNLAFYGLTNATEAQVPSSVESIGLCAFSYTEGTRTSVGDLNSEYQFDVVTDSSVVSKGDEFTVSVNLTADYKDILGLQTILLFDMDRISVDEDNLFDTQWYDSVDESNLGYISKPMSGIVANNVRIVYVALDGTHIDSESALYNQGKTTLTLAKIKCKALCDIEDVNTSCFYLKSSGVSLVGGLAPDCGESQLTTTTRLPMPQLVINGKDSADGIYEQHKKPQTQRAEVMTVKVNDTVVNYDTAVYADETGNIMIPLRHTVEALGGIVTWDNETKTAFALFGNELAAVQIGQNKVFKNNDAITMNAAAVIRDSRTIVPIEYIEKALGFMADYNEETNIITITTK